MNQQRRLVLNVVSSLLQVVISTLLLLVLYRYLVDSVGVEGLGIWSLVLAIGSATQIANLGLPGAITRFVAGYQAQGLDERVRVSVETSAVSIAVFGALLTLLAFPLGQQYLHFAMPVHLQAEALQILPVALAAFWLSMYSSTFQSALMGLERYAEANAVLIADSVLQLLLCVLLVPAHGLMGLVLARLACNVVTLVLTVGLTRRYLPGLPWISVRWSRAEFREMVGYAGGMQLIALLVMFADPVTKGLLGRFGSLTAVGYYEMADKLIKSLRALLVSANQVMLPKFAVIAPDERDRERQLFQESQKLNSFFAVPAFALLILVAPLVSVIWLGQQEEFFIVALEILGVGWLINVLALPTYFATLGAGEVWANVISHLVLAIANVALGWMLGAWLGASGVVLGWALALIVSSIVLVVGFSQRRRLAASLIFPESQRVLAAFSLLAVGVALSLHLSGSTLGSSAAAGSLSLRYWFVMGSFVVAILVAAYRNEARAEILSSLAKVIGRSVKGGPVQPVV